MQIKKDLFHKSIVLGFKRYTISTIPSLKENNYENSLISVAAGPPDMPQLTN